MATNDKNKNDNEYMKTSVYLLLAALMILGLASCTDDKTDNPADGTEVTTEEVENITDDQMAVMVTADLPTAVLRPFDEGSTGAALVKRLQTVTSEFGPDTRMVLVPGTMFDGATDMTDDELDALALLGIDGGYLAIERPTAMQLFNFATLYVAKLMDMQQLQYEEMFDLNEAAAARAARKSAPSSVRCSASSMKICPSPSSSSAATNCPRVSVSSACLPMPPTPSDWCALAITTSVPA